MIRRRILFGSTGLVAAAVVGVGAMTLGSGGTSLTSGSVPSSQVAATTNSQSSNSAPKPHPHFMFGGAGAAVYSESVVPQKGGSGYETIIEVKGKLLTISTTSISVIRSDTNATVTAGISPSTRFGNTTGAALAADLKGNTAVTVRLVEVAGNANAESVMVPLPPGTMPKHGVGSFRGAFPPPNRTTSNSSASGLDQTPHN